MNIEKHMQAVRRRVAAIEKAVHFMEGRQDQACSFPSEIDRHVSQFKDQLAEADSFAATKVVRQEYAKFRRDTLHVHFKSGCLAGLWAVWYLPAKLQQ